MLNRCNPWSTEVYFVIIQNNESAVLNITIIRVKIDYFEKEVIFVLSIPVKELILSYKLDRLY